MRGALLEQYERVSHLHLRRLIWNERTDIERWFRLHYASNVNFLMLQRTAMLQVCYGFQDPSFSWSTLQRFKTIRRVHQLFHHGTQLQYKHGGKLHTYRCHMRFKIPH